MITLGLHLLGMIVWFCGGTLALLWFYPEITERMHRVRKRAERARDRGGLTQKQCQEVAKELGKIMVIIVACTGPIGAACIFWLFFCKDIK